MKGSKVRYFYFHFANCLFSNFHFLYAVLSMYSIEKNTYNSDDYKYVGEEYRIKISYTVLDCNYFETLQYI